METVKKGDAHSKGDFMAFDAKDPDAVKAIKDAVEAAVTEATTGLQKKNQELLGKYKLFADMSKEEIQEAIKSYTEIDSLTTRLKEAEKLAKTATAEAEKIKKAYETESKVAHRLLVDNGLSTALLDAGVRKPAYQKAAKAMLAGQVVLTADGENRIAKVGDKLLKDFVAEWSKSDEGKAFVDAPINIGGGAQGGGDGKGAQKTLTRAAFDALNETARMEHVKAGGQLTA